MSDRRTIGRKPGWRVFTTRENRYVVLGALLLLLIGILVGGHLYGRYLNSLDLRGRENAIEQLRAESQQQKRKIDEQSAQLTILSGKVNDAQAQLRAILPSENTYNVIPNETLVVGDGRLMIGMIGAPGNDSIVLQINGKQQNATVGQAIAVTPEAGVDCKVTLQSFDVFKAVIHAECPGAGGKQSNQPQQKQQGEPTPQRPPPPQQ